MLKNKMLKDLESTFGEDDGRAGKQNPRKGYSG